MRHTRIFSIVTIAVIFALPPNPASGGEESAASDELPEAPADRLEPEDVASNAVDLRELASKTLDSTDLDDAEFEHSTRQKGTDDQLAYEKLEIRLMRVPLPAVTALIDKLEAAHPNVWVEQISITIPDREPKEVIARLSIATVKFSGDDPGIERRCHQ